MDEFSLFPDLERLFRKLWRKYKSLHILVRPVPVDYCASREHDERADRMNFGRLV
jgi:hypothetical protein